MKRPLCVTTWFVFWVVISIGIFVGAWSSNRAFTSYMNSGATKLQVVYDLLPSNVSFFAYDPHFRDHCGILRKSSFYGALKSVSISRDILDHWKLTNTDSSALERYILQFWGSQLAIAYSKETETFYLLSPLGNRENCVKWLQQMAFSPFGTHVNWKPKRLQNHWCWEVDSNYFLAEGFNIQFCLIRGVAVMAISHKSNPISDLLDVAEAQKIGLRGQTSNFLDFFQKNTSNSNEVFGFAHGLHGETDMEWSLLPEADGQISINVNVPSHNLNIVPTKGLQSDILSSLRQKEDSLSILCCWEDLQSVWKENSKKLPQEWVDLINQFSADPWFGPYKEYWDPVFNKLEHEVFISFGEATIVSEKYRVPVPDTILAIPFADSAAFFQAIEATILKCNQEFGANLLIRKVIRSYGEYYEIKMGDSGWKRSHGLKQLPVIAFSNGLLILATTDQSMESILQKLAVAASNASQPKIDGIDIQIQMKKAPSTIRILLAVFGVLYPQGKSHSLSPGAMYSVSEILNLMEQFQDAHMILTCEPNGTHLRTTLKY